MPHRTSQTRRQEEDTLSRAGPGSSPGDRTSRRRPGTAQPLSGGPQETPLSSHPVAALTTGCGGEVTGGARTESTFDQRNFRNGFDTSGGHAGGALRPLAGVAVPGHRADIACWDGRRQSSRPCPDAGRPPPERRGPPVPAQRRERPDGAGERNSRPRSGTGVLAVPDVSRSRAAGRRPPRGGRGPGPRRSGPAGAGGRRRLPRRHR